MTKDGKYIIGLDFNGTCVSYNYPHSIGNDIGSVLILKKLLANGHKFVLMTGFYAYDVNIEIRKRFNEMLQRFSDNGIEYIGINHNPNISYVSDKICCDLYIDDHCLGIPLKYDKTLSDRPYVDWEKTELLLIKMGLIAQQERQQETLLPNEFLVRCYEDNQLC